MQHLTDRRRGDGEGRYRVELVCGSEAVQRRLVDRTVAVRAGAGPGDGEEPVNAAKALHACCHRGVRGYLVTEVCCRPRRSAAFLPDPLGEDAALLGFHRNDEDAGALGRTPSCGGGRHPRGAGDQANVAGESI